MSCTRRHCFFRIETRRERLGKTRERQNITFLHNENNSGLVYWSWKQGWKLQNKVRWCTIKLKKRVWTARIVCVLVTRCDCGSTERVYIPRVKKERRETKKPNNQTNLHLKWKFRLHTQNPSIVTTKLELYICYPPSSTRGYTFFYVQHLTIRFKHKLGGIVKNSELITHDRLVWVIKRRARAWVAIASGSMFRLHAHRQHDRWLSINYHVLLLAERVGSGIVSQSQKQKVGKVREHNLFPSSSCTRRQSVIWAQSVRSFRVHSGVGFFLFEFFLWCGQLVRWGKNSIKFIYLHWLSLNLSTRCSL